MLLESEVKAGEIYVNDKLDILISREEEPALWQIVEMSAKSEQNPRWENIITGELVNWGTHCFTTIERMKRQFFNISSLHDKKRKEYVEKAYKAISDYELSLTKA